MPRPRVSRAGSPPVAATAKTSLMKLASGVPMLATKAMREPSGDHAGASTSKSPVVTRVTAASASAIVWRCSRRPSSSPASSLLKGRPRMCRAPDRSSTAIRADSGSSAVFATKASRWPSGAHARAEIASYAGPSGAASPPPSGAT